MSYPGGEDMASHKRPEVIRRLARIEGHVRSISRMVEQDRSYSDVIQQVSAVKAALDGVVQTIVDDLVEDCIKRVDRNPSNNRTLHELQQVISRAL